MLRSLGLIVSLGACGGGATDSTEETGLDPALCEDVHSYNLEDASCEQLQGAYHQILDGASACHTDSDCHALNSRCDVFFVNNCHVGVNRCLDQAAVDAVATAWLPCAGNPMASCLEPCPTLEVACVDGACVAR